MAIGNWKHRAGMAAGLALATAVSAWAKPVETLVPLTAGPGAPGNDVFGGVSRAVADLYRRCRQ